MTTEHPMLAFEPSQIIFPVVLNKKLSSTIRLLNKTDNHVFYKLLTTNPKKYGVRPRIGVLQPGEVCDIIVTTGALKEAPHSMRCKDRFKIQSAVASPGATIEDARNRFNKEAGHGYHEIQLRVVYSKPESSGSSSDSSEIDEAHDVPELTNPVIGPNNNVPKLTSPRQLLEAQPSELEVPSDPNKKDGSCSLQLSNLTEEHVAFMVKTLSPNYLVQPNKGILPPQATCNITVKVQVEISSDAQSEDKLLIQSMVSAAATMEDIQDMFDKASSPIEGCELQVVLKQESNTAKTDELILRGIIICLLGLISCYIMKQTLSLIWSVAMVVMMLMIKMVKKLVSENLEDWILRALIYIIMCIFGRKQFLS